MPETILSTNDLPLDHGGLKKTITIPDTTVPLFIVIGDSIGIGTNNLDTTLTDPDRWEVPATPTSAPFLGMYWDKWMSQVSGDTWTIADRALSTDPAGAKFERLHHKMGADAEGLWSDPTDVGPLWALARNLRGLFVYADGSFAVPHFVIAARGSTSVGENALGNPSTHWQDVSGSASEWLLEYYVKPAVNDLVAASTPPLLCGVFSMNSGFDGYGDQVFGGAMAGLAPVLHTNLLALRKNIHSFTQSSTIPWIQMLSHTPDPAVVTNPFLEIPEVRQSTHQFEQQNQFVELVDALDLEIGADATHPTADGTMKLGALMADAYLRVIQRQQLISATQLIAIP